MPRGPPRPVSVTNLTPVNPTPQGALPTIDTSTLFPTGVVNSVPNTCQTILVSAKTSGSKAAFMEQYRFADQRATLNEFVTKLKGTTVDQNQTVDSKPGFSDVDTFLTNLEQTQVPIQSLVSSCMRESVQPNIKAVQEARAVRDESKDRYEAIMTPERRTSYYEGWFPLFRPMTEAALFVLFGTALFLLLLSITIFLRMRGVELEVRLPEMAVLGFDLTPYRGFIIGGGIFGGLLTVGLWKFGYIG
jgi:hypothetical protein